MDDDMVIVDLYGLFFLIFQLFVPFVTHAYFHLFGRKRQLKAKKKSKCLGALYTTKCVGRCVHQD